jgi:hypothetical protein
VLSLSNEELEIEEANENNVSGLSRTEPSSATCLAVIGEQLVAIALTRVGAAS